MKLAAVYCGGCNPEIDREGLVQRLTGELGLTIYPYRKMVDKPDLLLVVNGCAKGCLTPRVMEEYKGKIIVVAGLSVDFWPVPEDKLIDILVKKVKEND